VPFRIDDGLRAELAAAYRAADGHVTARDLKTGRPAELPVPARPGLARVDDQAIAIATQAIRDLQQRWMAVPPDRTLRLAGRQHTLLRRAGNEERSS
jgi:hypothetical protein